MRAIITGDWHLRPDIPICRLDADWIATQKDHVRRIVEAAKQRSCPIYVIGDIFDTPRVPPEIEQIIPHILCEYNVQMRLIPGNHDMKYNAVDYVSRCSIGMLLCAKNVYELEDTPDIHYEHVLVFKDETDMPPNKKAITAATLLEQYPDKKYIITSDMHRAFHFKQDGRHVINPGCMNIQAADMLAYETGVWFVDTDITTIEWIALPDDRSLITAEHNLIKKEKSERISSFIEYLKSDKHHSLDFWETVRHKLELCPNSEIETIINNIKEQIV